MSRDYLCLIYAGFQASPFSLYAIFMKEKEGKGGSESLQDLTAGAEKFYTLLKIFISNGWCSVQTRRLNTDARLYLNVHTNHWCELE